MRKIVLLAVIAASLACAGVAAAKPFYVCANPSFPPTHGCLRRFNAERLVGLRLPAAKRLAREHGYEVMRVWPLRKGESVPAMERSGRIDVVCRSANENSVIVRIKGTG